MSLMSLTAMERIQVRFSVSSNSDNQLEQGKSFFSLVSTNLVTSFSLKELERERDEASQKLESTERKLERSSRDWQLERQAMEIELRDLRQKVRDLTRQEVCRYIMVPQLKALVINPE